MRTLLWMVGLTASCFAQSPMVLNSIAGGNFFSPPAAGPAISAPLVLPQAVAVDKTGNVFISDEYFLQVYKITPDGNLSLFAGNGASGYSGDGEKAVNAAFSGPSAMAADTAGNLYLADPKNAVIRQVNTQGVISTYAGNPNLNPGAGINGPATSFGFASPDGLATDAAGDLYVADNGQGSRTLLKISPNQNISLISGIFGFHGAPESGPAASTALDTPEGVAVDTIGNVFLVDNSYCGVYEISLALQFSQIGGKNGCGFTGDGSATGEALALPTYLAFGAPGNLYVSDTGNHRIRVIASGRMTTVAGTGVPGYNGDGIAANTAQIDAPEGIAADSAGNVYFAERGGRRVRKIDTQGMIHTIAGVGAALPVGDGGLATSAQLISPVGLVSDGKGTFYIADQSTDTIRKITPDGKIATIAGTGIAGYNGDGIAAKQALLNQPYALALDALGNLYVSDSLNNRVRMITPQGIIQTVAGTGVFGYNGDNMPANTAQLATPGGITFDTQGNLYIAEIDNHRLRKVSNGVITTIAGVNAHTSQVPDTDDGDGQSAAGADFVFLYGVAVDSAGNIYTADQGSLRVRKIGSDGIIRAFAGKTYTSIGNGTGGDGGFASNSILNGASQVAVDAAGDVFITGSDRIREVTTDGLIHTPAGGGTTIAYGNGQIASLVSIGTPRQVWPAPDGTFYLAAESNAAIFHYVTGQISRQGVQNVADLSSPGYISPGEIIVMYGSGLGPATLTGPTFTSSSTAFPTSIAGTQVLFDGVAAPLLYVQSGAIALVVPFEVNSGTTHVQVSVNGTMTNEVDMSVHDYAPAMWPSIVNADGTINSPGNPAHAGDVITFFVTGAGQTSPALTDGQFVNDAMHLLTAKVQALIGNGLGNIVYAGAAPDSLAGQMQIVVQIPANSPLKSNVGVLLLIGGQPVTPLVTSIAVQ